MLALIQAFNRLLIAAPFLLYIVSAAPFTNVKSDRGRERTIISSTDGNGQVQVYTTTTHYTSYYIIINDDPDNIKTRVGTLVSMTNSHGKAFTTVVPTNDIPDDIAESGSTSSTRNKNTSTPKPTNSPETDFEADTAIEPNIEADTESDTEIDNGEGGSSESKGGSGPNIGAIAGGSAGGVVALGAIAIAGYFYYRKYRRRKQIEEHKHEEMQMLAMDLGGTFSPDVDKRGGRSGGAFGYGELKSNPSFTDDLASGYTGGKSSLLISPPILNETFSPTSYHINVGTELSMDTQGRHGLPDGSPLIDKSILPLRDVKARDNYVDLEWFPLYSSDAKMEPHVVPKYVHDKGLSNVAAYIQGSATQKQISPIRIMKL